MKTKGRRILAYVPEMAFHGGMEQHVCLLLAELARSGARPTLIATSSDLGPGPRAMLESSGVRMIFKRGARHSSSWLSKAFWILLQVARLRGLRGFPVVYTNGQSALSRLAWKAAAKGGRIVHHHHTSADPGERRTWSAAYWRVVRSAPEVVGCSRATCRELADAGRPDARYLPYLTPEIPILPRKPRTSGHVRLGYIGRLASTKGVDAILRVAGSGSLPGVQWVVCGAPADLGPDDFKEYPSIEYIAGYRDRDHLGAILAGLDGLVLPTRHTEGQPLSLIEGLSAGLPFLATDRGGVSELACSPVCRLLPPDFDDARLVAELSAFSVSLRASLADAAEIRAFYDANFLPARVAGMWTRYLLEESG
jgi:glycosyltransferase involved in cell wall biosynthesis